MPKLTASLVLSDGAAVPVSPRSNTVGALADVLRAETDAALAAAIGARAEMAIAKAKIDFFTNNPSSQPNARPRHLD